MREKKKQYEAALDANLPALNANSHTRKKPYQKTSSELLAEQEGAEKVFLIKKVHLVYLRWF